MDGRWLVGLLAGAGIVAALAAGVASWAVDAGSGGNTGPQTRADLSRDNRPPFPTPIPVRTPAGSFTVAEMTESADIEMPDGLALTYATAPYRKGSGLIEVLRSAKSGGAVEHRLVWSQSAIGPGLYSATATSDGEIVLSTCLPAGCAAAGMFEPAETSLLRSRDGGVTFEALDTAPGRWIVIADGPAVLASEVAAFMNSDTQVLSDVLGKVPPAVVSRGLHHFDGRIAYQDDFGRLVSPDGGVVFDPEIPEGGRPGSYELVGETVWGQYFAPEGPLLAEWTREGRLLRAYRLFDRQTGPQHREGLQLEVHGALPGGNVLVLANFRRATSCKANGISEGFAPASFDPATGQLSFFREFVQETREYPCGRLSSLGMELLHHIP